MAIYIWSRPESLWSDSLTIFYHVYDRSSEIECKILLLFESTLCQCDSWGPLSQPACCQDKSNPRKTHPVINQWYSTYTNQQYWPFNPCKSRETLNFHTLPTVVIGMLPSDGWRFGFAFNKSFPTVYFGADVSSPCLCLKDATRDWFNIKKPSHGRK